MVISNVTGGLSLDPGSNHLGSSIGLARDLRGFHMRYHCYFAGGKNERKSHTNERSMYVVKRDLAVVLSLLKWPLHNMLLR